MKKILLTLVALAQLFFVSARPVFNIKDYGAKGNGKISNTEAINKAVKACNEQGGGIVYVPAGKYLSGTIELLDNVELRLAEGAELIASLDLKDYKNYECLRNDFMKYKVAYTAYWNRAFILAQRVKNIAITGDGVINSNHLVDPNGEGRARGPHGIMLGEVDGVTIRGIHITEASNYAVMGYEVLNATFDNVKITKGHDAIHLRGAKNLMIRDCSFETGDDCLAGGFWENAVIKNCYINSTCNGIRILFPVKDLEISHCTIKGPGKYAQPHIPKLTGKMLAAIIIQPGAWWDTVGGVEDVHIHDLDIDCVRCVFASDLKANTWSKNLVVERIKATNVNYAALQIESWKGGVYEDVTLRDIDIHYIGRNDEKTKEPLRMPTRESRTTPYWAMFVRNIKHLTMENLNFTFTGEEHRTPIGIHNVAKIDMTNVKAQDTDGKEMIHAVDCPLVPLAPSKNYIPITIPKNAR